MRLVLDASVTLCWCFKDESHPIAERAAALMLEDSSAIMPAIWWFEIRNAMTTGLRRKRVTDQAVGSFLSDLLLLRIALDPIPADAELFALAERHRLTFYDAAYLELARREDCPLATIDDALARAAATEGVALIGA